MVPSKDKIANLLGGIIADGFNRSLGALEGAGAIDARRLRSNYRPGSEYYDLVTAQIEFTAKYGVEAVLKLFATPTSDEGGSESQ
jgi:hypothetical protein